MSSMCVREDTKLRKLPWTCNCTSCSYFVWTVLACNSSMWDYLQFELMNTSLSKYTLENVKSFCTVLRGRLLRLLACIPRRVITAVLSTFATHPHTKWVNHNVNHNVNMDYYTWVVSLLSLQYQIKNWPVLLCTIDLAAIIYNGCICPTPQTWDGEWCTRGVYYHVHWLITIALKCGGHTKTVAYIIYCTLFRKSVQYATHLKPSQLLKVCNMRRF